MIIIIFLWLLLGVSIVYSFRKLNVDFDTPERQYRVKKVGKHYRPQYYMFGQWWDIINYDIFGSRGSYLFLSEKEAQYLIDYKQWRTK